MATKRTKPATDAPREERPLPTRIEIQAAGKAIRTKVSRAAHAEWKPPARRRDPISILIESSKGRIEQLVPIRYGRMLESPFAFYRGAAAIMAADLASTPSTGIRIQICGDCHLVNFGGFATPERKVIFDINDFDETHIGPWEWDVKRLAASCVVASRNNRHGGKDAREAGRAAAQGYRERMAELAAQPALEAWYSHLDARQLIDGAADPAMRKLGRKRLAKALSQSGVEVDYPKLVQEHEGKPRIKDAPPLVFHQEEGAEIERIVADAFAKYRESLPEERRLLFDRYHLVDHATKVVGVGSVGTLCAVCLFFATDDDPLFLQAKEARQSVLEPFTGKSVYANHGQRVVVGQRIMQAASDIFLGWTAGERGRHYYVRQLRDVKLKPQVEIYSEQNLFHYSMVCGWALARAHARSGQANLIAGYLGKSGRFDEAVADFAVAYADQNERDHAALVAAVRAGRVEAQSGA